MSLLTIQYIQKQIDKNITGTENLIIIIYIIKSQLVIDGAISVKGPRDAIHIRRFFAGTLSVLIL